MACLENLPASAVTHSVIRFITTILLRQSGRNISFGKIPFSQLEKERETIRASVSEGLAQLSHRLPTALQESVLAELMHAREPKVIREKISKLVHALHDSPAQITHLE